MKRSIIRNLKFALSFSAVVSVMCIGIISMTALMNFNPLIGLISIPVILFSIVFIAGILFDLSV